MKIRNGFVSNSSSSSFCIYGTYLEFEDLIKMSIQNNIITSKEAKDFEKNGEWYELETMINNKTGLELNLDEESNAWIGRSWSEIGDDETGTQFKDSVEQKLRELKIDGDIETFKSCP